MDELDDTSMWYQSQLEQQEYNELMLKEEEVSKQLNAMSDEEFFKWIGSIEKEVKNVSI